MESASLLITDTLRAVTALNVLLRGELSAVETFEQASLAFAPDIPMGLSVGLTSHQLRAEKLRGRIQMLGGVPAESSGVWGTFARLVEGGAKLFGRKAALAALEEGEDHGIALYREQMSELDHGSRQLVATDLLPAQLDTRDLTRSLHHSYP